MTYLTSYQLLARRPDHVPTMALRTSSNVNTTTSHEQSITHCRASMFSLLALFSWFSVLAAAASSSHSTPCVGGDAIRPNCSSSEASHHRDAFYLGGRYVYDSTLRGNLVYDQLYVEKLTPTSGIISHPYPLVFFHGGGPSGMVSLIVSFDRANQSTTPLRVRWR
jgi:hypothetical protein